MNIENSQDDIIWHVAICWDGPEADTLYYNVESIHEAGSVLILGFESEYVERWIPWARINHIDIWTENRMTGSIS